MSVLQDLFVEALVAFQSMPLDGDHPWCWMAGAQRGFVPSVQGGMSAALWGFAICGDALPLCCAPVQCQIHIAYSSI